MLDTRLMTLTLHDALACIASFVITVTLAIPTRLAVIFPPLDTFNIREFELFHLSLGVFAALVFTVAFSLYD